MFVHLLKNNSMAIVSLPENVVFTIRQWEGTASESKVGFTVNSISDLDFLADLPISELKNLLGNDFPVSDCTLAKILGVRSAPMPDQTWDDFSSHVSGAISVLPKISLEELLEQIH